MSFDLGEESGALSAFLNNLLYPAHYVPNRTGSDAFDLKV